MRIVYITAGAAGLYCGACARDVALVRALAAKGHDVRMMPLYTPIRADGPDPSVHRVFYGGISVYLEQHWRLFRHAPAFLLRLLDSPVLLRFVSRFAINTSPARLGAMTVSVLEGAAGRQRRELDRLLDYLSEGPAPEVVHITNSLLSALSGPVRERFGVPVFCTLQGGESFVADLPQPHRDRAAELLRRHAQVVDRFVSPGRDYARRMAEALDVPPEKVAVVRAGLNVERFTARPGPRARRPFRIGYLSRVTPSKGLDLLCDAFRVMEHERPGAAVLAVAGQMVAHDRPFWEGLYAQMETDGLADRVVFAGEVGFPGKLAFLHACSVFCQPERFDEPRGMACLEAMATGVPAVVPARGIFPEIVELTGGGLCIPPDDTEALADALCSLRDDPDRADRLGEAAREGVLRHFSADRAADATLALYREAIEARD